MRRTPLILGLVIAAQASAEAPAARLDYTRGAGAESCPDQRSLEDAVSARLGYPPFRTDAARTLTARVSASGRGLLARMELRDAGGNLLGKRDLAGAGEGCGELAAAMELAIAIAIDPASATRPPPPLSEAPPPSQPPPPPPPPPADEPSPPV